ncbi:MAG: hypothetical protein HN368_04635, partial [Spirochaetales bacterium]|nr:hypothetical protein [Spirochaetales bacterium]
KNFLRVAAVCDPGDYDKIISEMAAHDGTLSLKTRFACAQKAFMHTAEYDTLISEYLGTFDSESLESVYNIE